MKLAMISFTQQGGVLAGTIEKALAVCNAEWEIVRFAFWKYPVRGAVSFEKGDVLTKALFSEYDALVFISAAGIAVRLTAPCVTSKVSDPAVLCIDEQGKFVVSLLSGHLGGANALTKLLAECIAAQPVITTATDTGGRFSPDSFAAANHLEIEDMDMAKEVAAAVVRGEPVGLLCEYPCRNVPEQMVVVNGICISDEKRETPFVNTLYLKPKDIILGIGCKRDTEPELLEAFVLKKLKEYDIALNAVREICSVDRKKDEQAILAFAGKYRLPFHTFSPAALMEVPGAFTASDFVREVTGADNVCERSAMLHGRELIMPKQAENGVTLAAAKAKVEPDFQKGILS